MGTTTLVTGSPRQVAAVRRAAGRFGIEVFFAHDLPRCAELCDWLGFDSVDCYIQLPMAIDPDAGCRTVVDRAGDFLAGGLLTRYALADTVVPTLRTGATVTLVAGHEADVGLPDDARARRDLLGVLGRAVAVDTTRRGVCVNVISSGTLPEEIAEIAVLGVIRRSTVDYSGMVPGGTYDDWRREALSHVSHH